MRLKNIRSSNVVWHKNNVSRQDREVLINQKGKVLWLTGLSGSGKSTIANALERKLLDAGFLTYLLDGDNLRHGLNGDLGFEEADRKENIRRVIEVSRLFLDAGIITLISIISPYMEERKKARNHIGKDYVEIYVKCPVTICKTRDPKKLYEKAEKGEIKNFTGLDSPYEEPVDPEIVLETDKYSVDECVDRVFQYLGITEE